MSFACVGGRREIGIYLEALKAAGKDPARYSIVNSRVVYIADSEEQAWRDTRDALMYQAELYGKWLSAAAGTTDQSKVLIRPDAGPAATHQRARNGLRSRRALEEILASTPMTELIVVTQLPGLDPAKARRSLDRFGAEVLPRQ